jgi:hypothetical protein
MTENQRPTTYQERAAILADIQESFYEPASIRDPEISYAVPSNSSFQPNVQVCLRANAKDRRGLYTGAKTRLYLFGDTESRLLSSLEHSNLCGDSSLRYEPFMLSAQETTRRDRNTD